ncbi:uncharacterized protein CcaverHIS019_0103080 [Cutaneotrichosporon cavernicola]|uniref:C2H2-type domain-containing protein n=1 Tax=Cutaneotrichosporon cavernicola TaxID=279322 RepID=A0AA48L008_9TREE|nr:uncharacterized protein CcaverHIS019_0103080 [Cutaneotrichosporon cavernicola]BEI87590.1 hypothetical protein CcaverHIS019_0103080 [Cutaneotrichosporon cavernicola]BEI95361.1 hypothetical protein CcaverHIS631_0103100 [Cutaneotrichosporon cavernicola]BEJ03135.1 hypothetical protein CcaverHIS641_0103100 [Cutaneotrichosporon cavernicola]
MATAEPQHIVSVDGFHDFTHFNQRDFSCLSQSGGMGSLSGHNSQVESDAESSPIHDQHSFSAGDLSGNSSFEWNFQNMMPGSTSSSYEQSLDTPPNLSQSSFAESNEINPSQVGALGFLNPAQLNLPTSTSTSGSCASGSPTGVEPILHVFAPSMVSPQLPTADNVNLKRKRQNSLPDLYSNIEQGLPPSRPFHRSVSIGTVADFEFQFPVVPSQNSQPLPPFKSQSQSQPPQERQRVIRRQRTVSASNSPCLDQSAPIDGLMSAMPITQHPQSFAPVPQTQGPPASVPPQNMPNRTFNRSLATIPEAPSNAQPHVTWTTSPHLQDGSSMLSRPTQHLSSSHSQSQQPVFEYSGDMAATYTMPAPPVAPQLPSPAFHPSPMLASPAVGHSPMLHSPAGTVTTATPTLPPTVPRSFPHGRALSMSGMPTFANVKPHQQMQQQPPPQMAAYSQQINSAMASAMMPVMQPQQVGMGRPIHTPAHIRRSSDSELALATYQPNVSTMLRSTSVPQVPPQAFRHNGAQVFGGMLGFEQQHQVLPPPPVTTYSASGMIPGHAFHQYQPTVGFGQPSMPGSPPRKRPAPKRQRVGNPLKPGPRGKKALKMPSPVPTALVPAPYGATLDTSMFVAGNGSICTDPKPTCARIYEPVGVDEFRAAFDVTSQGTLVIKPTVDMDQLVERLLEMHFTGNTTVVDQCFRECYEETSEWNEAAQKKTKYFKCRFDECRDHPFPRKSAIDSHVKTHVGFREFRCTQDPECRISFVRKHDRDRHHLTHRESKTFKCPQCGEDFARSDALLRHGAKPGACKARMVDMGI